MAASNCVFVLKPSEDPHRHTSVALLVCRQSYFCQSRADGFMGNGSETKHADFEGARCSSPSLIAIMYVCLFKQPCFMCGGLDQLRFLPARTSPPLTTVLSVLQLKAAGK